MTHATATPPAVDPQLMQAYSQAYAAIPHFILQALACGCPNEAQTLTRAALNAANALAVVTSCLAAPAE